MTISGFKTPFLGAKNVKYRSKEVLKPLLHFYKKGGRVMPEGRNETN